MKLLKEQSLLLLGSSVVIGIVTDILVRQDIFGLNFLLWSSLWVGILLVQLYRRKKINYRTCLYATFALTNAIMVYIRAEPVVQVWSVFSTLSFMTLLFGAVYLDYFFELPLTKRFFEYIAGSVTSAVETFGAISKSAGRIGAGKPVNMRATLGAVIATTLALIFIGLFSSSDQVFRKNFSWLGNALTSFGDWFGNFNIGRIITVTFWIVVALGWLAMVISRKKIENMSDIRLTKFLSFKDSQVIMGVVSAVFALFVFVQLRFLFGGATLPDGITYASYARSGYGQLLLATMLASGVVYITKNSTKITSSKTVKWLAILLLGLNAVVVLSAWKRLNLYESAYGWTMTRFVARMGLVCIMAGIVYLFIWVLGKLSNRQVFAMSWYTLAFVLLVSAVINPIGLITKHNIVDLSEREVPLDVRHLSNQSADSYKAICQYAPVLKDKYPADYIKFIDGYLYTDSVYDIVVAVKPVEYSSERNHGLAAHYTKSSAFAVKYYNCLQK